MSFNLVSIDHDGIAHVALSGDLDHDPASGKQNPLAHCLGQEWASNRVMLDMDKAEYLNSTALGWLLQSQKTFDRAGGKLVLHSVPPSVNQVIRMMRIDKVLTLTPDAQQARQILSQTPAPGSQASESQPPATGDAVNPPSPGTNADDAKNETSGGGDHTHDA